MTAREALRRESQALFEEAQAAARIANMVPIPELRDLALEKINRALGANELERRISECP